MARRIEVFPCFEPGIPGVHRYRIELPLKVASFRIERLDESGLIKVIARTDQYVILYNNRRDRRKVLLVETQNFLVPAFLAGASVDGYQIIVGSHKEKPVAPHSDSPITDVCAALRFPEVVPQLVTIPGVERPRVVRCGDVQDPVHLKDGAFNLSGSGGDDLPVSFATDDQG